MKRNINRVEGGALPRALRNRGIRWVMPSVVRLHFKHEQELREEGFRAGYSAAQGETPALALRAYKATEWPKHCIRKGFTTEEFDQLKTLVKSRKTVTQ